MLGSSCEGAWRSPMLCAAAVGTAPHVVRATQHQFMPTPLCLQRCSYAYGMLAAMFSAGIWLVSAPACCACHAAHAIPCYAWLAPVRPAPACTLSRCECSPMLTHSPPSCTDSGHLLGAACVLHPHHCRCRGGHDDGGSRARRCQLERTDRQLPIPWGECGRLFASGRLRMRPGAYTAAWSDGSGWSGCLIVGSMG